MKTSATGRSSQTLQLMSGLTFSLHQLSNVQVPATKNVQYLGLVFAEQNCDIL